MKILLLTFAICVGYLLGDVVNGSFQVGNTIERIQFDLWSCALNSAAAPLLVAVILSSVAFKAAWLCAAYLADAAENLEASGHKAASHRDLIKSYNPNADQDAQFKRIHEQIIQIKQHHPLFRFGRLHQKHKPSDSQPLQERTGTGRRATIFFCSGKLLSWEQYRRAASAISW